MGDVPEFQPKISLELGIQQVIDSMDQKKEIPNSDEKNYWEDQIIKAQKTGKPLKKVKKVSFLKLGKFFLK